MRRQRTTSIVLALGLALTACGSDDPADPGAETPAATGADAADDPQQEGAPAEAAESCGEGRPVNAAEVVAAAAFQPPWDEGEPRGDGAQGWVANVEQFPSDAGFEETDPAAVADATARGLVETRNRQFQIPGPDEESGTDDAYAVVFAADFGTCEQAAAAATFAADAARNRPDGASDGAAVEGIAVVTWTYSIAQCTPNGFEVTCEDEPPWTVFHVLGQVDRYAVLTSVQWPTGMTGDGSEAIALMEDLIANFGQ